MELLSKRLARLPGNQKGMTLIELLAVLIILGIILAIAVPSISNFVNRSKELADKNTYLMVKEAGLRYAIAENITDSVKVVTIATLVNGGYLANTPTSQTKKTTFASVKISLSGNKYTVDVCSDEQGNTVIDPTVFDS